MPTTTYGGKGTVLQIAYPTTAFVTISNRVEIDGPESEMGHRDITHLDSVAKEFAPTLPDNGMISGRLWYNANDDTHKALQQLVSVPSTVAAHVGGLIPFKLILATTTKFFLFDGMPKRFKVGGMTPEGTVEADYAILISGAVTHPTTT